METGLLRALALFVASGAGSGYAPVAPGTFGSLAGVLLYLAIAGLPPALYLLATLGLLSLGVWAADVAEAAYDRKDDGRIVIDEVVGQLLTLAPLVLFAPVEFLRTPWLLVTGFVLFRVLDIWKGGPMGWAENHFKGGAGVMLDDVAAGLIGAVPMTILVGIAT